MGQVSKREIISQQQSFALPPATLFSIFIDPENGNELLGTQKYEVIKGQPRVPGKMSVLATYDGHELAKHIPAVAGHNEVISIIDVTLAEKPYRVLAAAVHGAFNQQSEILFTPHGSGTLVAFETAYSMPQQMVLSDHNIRRNFTTQMYNTFYALAKLTQDAKTLTALRRTRGALPN